MSEIETSIWSMSGPDIFAMLHSTPYIWWATTFLGLSWGLYRYGRSLIYLYYYYIEHGDVIWSMENHWSDMKEVIKKHKLYEYFTPHGYVTGLVVVLGCGLLGFIVGVIYPITIVIGILTIPNITLRWLAKEKRSKTVFQQKLKDAKA